MKLTKDQRHQGSLGPAQALLRPCLGPAQALLRPCFGPAQALLRPCLGPAQALLRPLYLHLISPEKTSLFTHHCSSLALHIHQPQAQPRISAHIKPAMGNQPSGDSVTGQSGVFRDPDSPFHTQSLSPLLLVQRQINSSPHAASVLPCDTNVQQRFISPGLKVLCEKMSLSSFVQRTLSQD